ncbi:unnamed protein product, partial [Polarella glacialis]
QVPQIRLEINDPVPKFPVTTQIRIDGIIESELDPTVPLSFSWRIMVYSLNPLYDLDRAREAASNPDVDYRVDKMVYLDQSDVYDVTNITNFFTRPDVPNMVIKALDALCIFLAGLQLHPSLQSNVLQPTTLYKSSPQLQGFAEARLPLRHWGLLLKGAFCVHFFGNLPLLFE